VCVEQIELEFLLGFPLHISVRFGCSNMLHGNANVCESGCVYECVCVGQSQLTNAPHKFSYRIYIRFFGICLIKINELCAEYESRE